MLDVGGTTGDAGADQAPGRVHAELLVIDDGGRVEFLGKMAGRELVGALKALVIREGLVLHFFEDALLPPAYFGNLLSPDVALVGLHFAESALGPGIAQDVHFFIGS